MLHFGGRRLLQTDKDGVPLERKWEYPLSPTTPYFDPLTTFYNFRLGWLGEPRAGETYRAAGIPLDQGEPIRIRLVSAWDDPDELVNGGKEPKGPIFDAGVAHTVRQVVNAAHGRAGPGRLPPGRRRRHAQGPERCGLEDRAAAIPTLNAVHPGKSN